MDENINNQEALDSTKSSMTLYDIIYDFMEGNPMYITDIVGILEQIKLEITIGEILKKKESDE